MQHCKSAIVLKINKKNFKPHKWSLHLWQPTQVSLSGKSHGQRSLVGYSPWGRKESDMTEPLTLTYLIIKEQTRLSSSQNLPNFLKSHIQISVQFSCSVMSDSLQPHGLQHTRLPCPSPMPELTQTHVHQVGDAIQPPHPLPSPSPPAFNLPQHQGVFQLVSSSHQVAKVLEFQLQHQSFQWIFRTDFF